MSETFSDPRNIRHAELSDIPAIKALEEGAESAAHWSEAQYREAFSSHSTRVIFVVEDQARVLGFAVAAGVGEEWEIENLVVAQDFRRQGLAGKLLLKLMDHVAKNGALNLLLEVRESNTPARQFYEKWAFIQVTRRKNYYRQPAENAIIYRRDLA